MDIIMPILFLLVLFIIGEICELYARLDMIGDIILTLILSSPIIAIIYKKYNPRLIADSYVESAIEFISLIEKSGISHGGYLCEPYDIYCFVSEEYRDVNIGIHIRGYTEYLESCKMNGWESVKLLQYIMGPLRTYLGPDAAEKFVELNCEISLLNNDIETPLIKISLTMPNYSRQKHLYIKSIKSRYESLYGRKIDFVPCG